MRAYALCRTLNLPRQETRKAYSNNQVAHHTNPRERNTEQDVRELDQNGSEQAGHGSENGAPKRKQNGKASVKQGAAENAEKNP